MTFVQLLNQTLFRNKDRKLNNLYNAFRNVILVTTVVHIQTIDCKRNVLYMIESKISFSSQRIII